MKNKFIKTGLLMSALALMVSCNDNEATGDSVKTPSSPTLSVALGFTANQNLVEVDMDYTFTVSLSEPQIVDVNVKLEQVAGTATDGDDFIIPHTVKIAAGTTSATATISLLADELIEETETATIRIGTGLESNVQAINSAEVNFTIGNLTSDDLVANLSWATQVPVTDHLGNEIAADDLLDLRLLLTDASNRSNVIDAADGGTFETYELDGSTPDGTYYLVADFYTDSTIPSDLGKVGIDLTLQFDQVGTINGQVLNFPGALYTDFACSAAFYTLAKVIKTGGSYEIVNVAAKGDLADTASAYVGTHSIVADDWADYATGDEITVEAGANPNQFFIRAYTNPYIANALTAYMIVDIDPATGALTVSSNEFFDYGQPGGGGGITGTGTANPCTGEVNLTLNFDLAAWGAYPGQAFNIKLK